MDGNLRAVVVQACHNSRTDSPGSTCNEYDSAGQAVVWHREFLVEYLKLILKDFTSHMQHDKRLPEPDSVSAAHSARVAEFIRQRIAAAGGSISFAEYMQHALYAPGLGYYVAGTSKFGEAGDFVTAPEMSSVFGRVLARQAAEVLAATEGGAMFEFGAGSGRLAADILRALHELGELPLRYDILEVSADLRERQERLLRSEVPELTRLVNWVDAPPAEFPGVVIANEVLDAFPVERFRRTADGVQQLRVASHGESFEVVAADAPGMLRDAVAVIERDLGYALPPGYESEVSLGLREWVAGLGSALRQGVAFLFDYGVSRREYYAPGRDGGWLRCHFRHHAHNDALVLPGIQDITAWVDFTAVAEAAVANGLEVAGFAPQALFLMGGGLDLELQSLESLPAKKQLELSAQVKNLALPGAMGENFKCMALRRGDVKVPSAFRLTDRTHTL